MFYVIRVIFIAILVLSTIYLTRKGKQLQKQRAEQGDSTEIVVKKRYYVYSAICTLIFFAIIEGSFYPFEKHFLTFSSEEAAFSYICKDSSDYERFEKGNAIFYVDRDERTDTLYTITKIGDRYSYVDYEVESAKYLEDDYFVVTAVYNKTENMTFYNVVAYNVPFQQTPIAYLNEKPLTYATIADKRWFNGIRRCDCYYYFDEAEPIGKITIETEKTSVKLNKVIEKHWLFVTYTQYSDADE